MSNKKVTAVQWLREQFHKTPQSQFGNLFQQAIEMERQQKAEFAVEWVKNCPVGGDVQDVEHAKKYYAETYGGQP